MSSREREPPQPIIPRKAPRRASRLQERAARAVTSGRVFPYLAAATAATAGLVGVVVRAIDPKDFHSVGEGIWWAIVTLATVGYGDVVPTSPWGRLVGSVVIVIGVTFLTFLTATVTSFFVSTAQNEAGRLDEETRRRSEEETRELLRRLDHRLTAIETKLDRLPGDRP